MNNIKIKYHYNSISNDLKNYLNNIEKVDVELCDNKEHMVDGKVYNCAELFEMIFQNIEGVVIASKIIYDIFEISDGSPYQIIINSGDNRTIINNSEGGKTKEEIQSEIIDIVD